MATNIQTGAANDRAAIKLLNLKIARNLQAGFSKDTLGASRPWAEVDKKEQEAWIRTARRATRLFTETKPD